MGSTLEKHPPRKVSAVTFVVGEEPYFCWAAISSMRVENDLHKENNALFSPHKRLVFAAFIP